MKDFTGYYAHVPDGIAFDGAEWLYLCGDLETATLVQAFMWFKDNQCYFSIGTPGNPDAASSGTCDLGSGHRTVTYYVHGEAQENDVDEVTWYFSAQSEHANKFEYEVGDWGPIASMTTERYG